MSAIKEKYYTYYDSLFSKKDYKGEVESVLQFARDNGVDTIKRILDVGCGTGNHAFQFAKHGYSVIGTDTDCFMIAIANKKLEQSGDREQLQFFCKDVQELKESEFDIAVSLFHVVNYIEESDDLLQFFRAIHGRLREHGLFVFDCWNGVAAIADNPKEKKTLVEHQDEKIEIDMIPEINLMEQRVVMQNNVHISSGGKEKDAFSFDYAQRLWTPWHLTQILEKSGFQLLRITSWPSPNVEADHNTWKITFICKKTKK